MVASCDPRRERRSSLTQIGRGADDRRGPMRCSYLAWSLVMLAGCNGGEVGTGGEKMSTGGSTLVVGPGGARRLSRVEYDNTLRDLLGDASRPGFAALPEDVHDPFD